VAFSLTRVPQVGHNFEVDVDSGVIMFYWNSPMKRDYTKFFLGIHYGTFARRRFYDMLKNVEAYSIYLHIPFCIHRCSYCDFTTYAGKQDAMPAYVRALCREIESTARGAYEALPIHTIFLGGGTPSLLAIEDHFRILNTIRSHYNLLAGAEITLEANPGTVSPSYLDNLREAGFNRISFGMQTASPEHLRLLERQHDPYDVIEAVKWARQAGFEQINLDLIFGLPNQSIKQWQTSLEFAVGLKTEHLSLYALTIESGTPLFRWVNRGLIPEPDPDEAAEMYEWAAGYLEQNGFRQYEISNWARQAADGTLFACRHNLQYWKNQSYFGFGAGAHGYIARLPGRVRRRENKKPYQEGDLVVQGVRTANVLRIEHYIQRVSEGEPQPFPYSPANRDKTPIDVFTEMQETMMVGLRLTRDGVASKEFFSRFGRPMTEVFDQEIRLLTQRELLEWAGGDGDILRLTQRGRLLGNQVFMYFVGKPLTRKGQSTTTRVP
jgi:oxygen-independent coproporphyrinogen-3 oxidase